MVKFRCQSQIIPKKEALSMDSLHSLALESNRQMKINFDGGDFSSDASLLLVKEFAYRLGFVKILKSMFKTKDTAHLHHHKDVENLWQIIYQILSAYFEDNYADELTNDPVRTAIIAKRRLLHSLHCPIPEQLSETSTFAQKRQRYCLQGCAINRLIPSG